MTDEEKMLENVINAINTIMLGGQSYSIAGRSLTRADLGQLREMKAELEIKVTRNRGTLMDNTVCAVFEGR